MERLYPGASTTHGGLISINSLYRSLRFLSPFVSFYPPFPFSLLFPPPPTLSVFPFPASFPLAPMGFMAYFLPLYLDTQLWLPDHEGGRMEPDPS